MQSLRYFTSGAVALMLMTVSPLQAQKTTSIGVGGGGSPHVKSEWVAGGANVVITYGRPSLKGRSDAQMMPVGKPWRTGADEASLLTTDKPLRFGTVTVQPGTYTINTEPGDAEWKFILGKLGNAGQWGIPYLPNLEIGRAPMKVGKTAAPVEMVTFAIEPTKDGGTLHVQWGSKDASIPFTVVK